LQIKRATESGETLSIIYLTRPLSPIVANSGGSAFSSLASLWPHDVASKATHKEDKTAIFFIFNIQTYPDGALASRVPPERRYKITKKFRKKHCRMK